jgi:hypothetical protein
MVEDLRIAKTRVDDPVGLANDLVMLPLESRNHAADKVMDLRRQPSRHGRSQQLDPLDSAAKLTERHRRRERRIASVGRHRAFPLTEQ